MDRISIKVYRVRDGLFKLKTSKIWNTFEVIRPNGKILMFCQRWKD